MIAALGVTGTALAHHSYAVYDHTRAISVTGIVTKWQWTNPHAYLDIDVKEPDGAVRHYSLESISINQLQRIGWHVSTIKAGDEVKVVFAPLLSGQPGGVLLEITLPNGQKKVLQNYLPEANTFKRTSDTH